MLNKYDYNQNTKTTGLKDFANIYLSTRMIKIQINLKKRFHIKKNCIVIMKICKCKLGNNLYRTQQMK